MHNKILTNTGFYLLLLFAFLVTVYPVVSYGLAAAIVLIWLLDVLIFKETDIVDLPLFYPLISFASVIVLGWALSLIFKHEFPYIFLAILSLFYFIVPGFVRSAEQRRMILWTFIAGAMLVASLHLIFWWATFTNVTMRLRPLPEPSLFMVALAFAFILAYYAESHSIHEKIFLSLVAFPLALVVVLSADKTAILFLLAIVLIAAIFYDRTIFIPFAVAMFFMLSGAFGIDYFVEQNLIPIQYKEFLSQPFTELSINHKAVLVSSFYGQATTSGNYTEVPHSGHSYFAELIKQAGPPAILLLFWILFERAREAYFKHRRSTKHQPRAYHLIALLTIIALIVMNTYDSVFNYPSIVLASWLILGMSEA
jgi:hypothetical protein